ncbi:MAG: peptidoglycan-binding protein [Bryobacteraceae bacterium]
MENGEDINEVGGIAADLPVDNPLALFLSPTNDGKGRNSIRARLIPVGCWRLDDVRFAFGSSFLLPNTKKEFGELDALIKKHPKAPLTIFGHADPVGNDDFNKRLSGERAETVYALLIRDTARWEKLYKSGGSDSGWGIGSVQQMLAALGHDPGPVTGSDNAKTKAAVTEFQKKSPGLSVDGAAGPATRAKLFNAYMDFLCPVTLAKTDFLGKGQDPGGKADYQGCSEFNPAQLLTASENQNLPKSDRDRENGVNRRVMLLLFAPGTQPPAKWPCPRATDGVAGCKKRLWSDGEKRRTPGPARRKFSETQDTFACRFYHRLSVSSPCEGVKPAPVIEWIQYEYIQLQFLEKRDWWPAQEDLPHRHAKEAFDTKLTNRDAQGELDPDGQVEFLQVPAGQCKVRLTKFFEAADKLVATPFEWPKPGAPKPAPPLPPGKDPELNLVAVDNFFAPGTETLTIRYDINELEGETVKLIVTPKDRPGTVVFERELTADEAASGANKTIEWDGIAANGKHVTPVLSPYNVSLQLADGRFKGVKPTQVSVEKLELRLDAAGGKFIMNDPEKKILVSATVLIRNKTGNPVKAPIAIPVDFTFAANAGNATPAGSFSHAAGKNLGKAGDPTAFFWEAHPASAATSSDGFTSKVKVETGTSGANLAIANVFFLPAGTGGDKYKINVAAGGASNGSAEIPVFRKVVFKPFEMQGQTHVSTNGTTALMKNFYKPEVFVEYELGAVTQIAAKFKVKYIGLWDHATQAQKSWAAVRAKTAAETPAAPMIAAANGPDGAVQIANRAAIRALATVWFNRISRDELACLAAWATDAGLPANAMVSIEDRHPKFSAVSPDSDAITAEWAGMPWLEITVAGRKVHPDARWQRVQGFAFGSRAHVMAGTSGARARVVVAHEAGHESKNQFKRAVFGPGDHSPADGLMEFTASLSDFTAAEIKILKGLL